MNELNKIYCGDSKQKAPTSNHNFQMEPTPTIEKMDTMLSTVKCKIILYGDIILAYVLPHSIKKNTVHCTITTACNTNYSTDGCYYKTLLS